MIPLVELRGAVPVAIASGIPWWQALILCVIGNMTNLLSVASLPGVLKKVTVVGKNLKKLPEIRGSSGPSSFLWEFHFQEQEPGLVP